MIIFEGERYCDYFTEAELLARIERSRAYAAAYEKGQHHADVPRGRDVDRVDSESFVWNWRRTPSIDRLQSIP